MCNRMWYRCTGAFLALMWVCCVPALRAQVPPSSAWHIHSPAPDTLIGEGALFVVVSLQPGRRLDVPTVALFLDGQDLTRQAKISETSVRLLYTRTLGSGRHELYLTAQNQQGEVLPPLRWQFRIEGEERAPTVRVPRSRFSFYGNTALDTRTSDFSGRQDLRQEPDHTYAVQVDAEGQYGGFTFPVRVFLTTDEGGGAQPRNRFQLGVRSRRFSLLFGDNTPLYNPLMLNGARTRGFWGEVHLRPLHLSGTRGLIRRGIAPEAFRSGTFERTLTAFRLGIGSERTVLWSLNAVHARDDVNSIPVRTEVPGITPMENLILGSDLSLRFLRGRLQLEGGAAISLTTEDISRGPATKAEIDSLFDTNLPIDPASYSWLITLNATTVPLRVDQLTSAAYYVKGRAAAGGHTLNAEFEHIGEAYVSFGNPFLLNDRRSLTVTDRFKILNGKVAGTLRYRHYGTPPRTDANLATLDANLFSGQLVLSPWRRPTWFYLSARLHDRNTTPDGSADLVTDTRLKTYSVGAYHLARTGGFQHGLNVAYTSSDRTDAVRPTLDNTTQTFTVGLHEQLPNPVYFNIQVNRLVVRSDELGSLQKLTTFSGRLGYRLPAQQVNLSMGLQNTHTAAALFQPVSDRFTFFLNGTYRVRNNMDLELQVGYNTYNEDVIEENQYTERYVILRHRYTF